MKRNNSDYYDWCVDLIIQNPDTKYCDVTLSFKSCIKQPYGTYEWITEAEIIKANKELLKRLNILVLKHAYRRHHKKLTCIPVIEQNRAKNRWHVHMLLEIPKKYHKNPNIFLDAVRMIACGLRWFESGPYAQHLIRVIPEMQHALGWLGYILKEAKFNLDVIDLQNLSL